MSSLVWIHDEVKKWADNESPVQGVLFVNITTEHPHNPNMQRYAKTQMIETLGYELHSVMQWYAEPVEEPTCFITRSAHSDQVKARMVATILAKLNASFALRGLGKVDLLICRPLLELAL